MHTFNVHGVAASSGIAIGKVQVVSNAFLEVQHYKIKKADLDNEKNRLFQAIALVKMDLKNIKKDINQKSSSDFSSFIDIHLMMLEDKNFTFYPQEIIKSEQCNAEWAIKTQLDLVISKFDAIDDPYIKERKLDVTQVAERLIKILLGHQHKKNAQKNPFSTILVAHDISPADALQFKNHNYAAFILSF